LERLEIKKAMKRKSRPRRYLWLVILAGVILAVSLTVSSLKIISGGKNFIKMINEENKAFVANTLRFGHSVMAHMGSENYDSLIDLALKSKFIKFLAILDEDGNIMAQSDLPSGIHLLKSYDALKLEDGKILEKTKKINLISYKAQPELVSTRGPMMPQIDMMGRHQGAPKPGWFLVGMDTSLFKRHYRDIVIQTFETGAAFLLLGLLIIVYTGIIQRYELAHLSIERLQKIKRLMGFFVPSTAKNIIEKDPEKKGLLDKYLQDASILFLDIEDSTLLQEKYSQEKINRTVEYYFSIFLNLIQKGGGDINETAGDGMMVIFLDSDPIKHAQNAVKTALEIQERCRQSFAENDPDKISIKVNIGIHSGKVYLGSTKMRASEAERWTFTASGMITNMAARLSQYAKRGQILLGEETARRVEKDYPLDKIGKIPLKNVKDSGEIYEISSQSSAVIAR
jgi:class 3 adenylate cyclase